MRNRILAVTGAFLALFGGSAMAGDMPGDIEVLTDSRGFVAIPSNFGVEETTSRLTDSLERNENINLLGVVDHSAAAASVDMELPPTRVVFFGNPALGSPLMQRRRSVGIDLPQKLLVWEGENGTTYVGYNTTPYLSTRHELPADIDQLQTINGALANFASSVAGEAEAYRTELASVGNTGDNLGSIAGGSGLESVTSNEDFATTVSNLELVLEDRGFRVPFVVEHSRAAAANDIELGPTTLFIFGNPNVGTPLMQLERRIAVDLPQKMLVWEDDDGTVRLTYNNPAYVLNRHGVADLPPNVTNIAGALAGIAEAAAGE